MTFQVGDRVLVNCRELDLGDVEATVEEFFGEDRFPYKVRFDERQPYMCPDDPPRLWIDSMEERDLAPLSKGNQFIPEDWS